MPTDDPIWWCPEWRRGDHEHRSRFAASSCVFRARFRRRFIDPPMKHWWRLIRWFNVTHEIRQ
jgi:hypothetical protein